jgi:hypothetical protein
VFHPTVGGERFPRMLGGMMVVPDWGDVITIAEENRSNADLTGSADAPLRAVVYPCSSLQVLA